MKLVFFNLIALAILIVTSKAGVVNFADAMLDPYYGDIPSNIDELFYKKIAIYNGEYYTINSILPICSGLNNVLGCYVKVAIILSDFSILPTLNDSKPNLSSNNSEDFNDIKRELSEYYCGKDSFYSSGDKYICLRPYGGSYSQNVVDMLNKRIINYNGKNYILNLLFSNICSLDIGFEKCYDDIAMVLNKEGIISLVPKDIDNSANDINTEEIMDKYRCGEENFYVKDNIHICLEPVMNEDIPTEFYRLMESFFIRYNYKNYKVNKLYSSIEAIYAGHPMNNFVIFSKILDKEKVDYIAPLFTAKYKTTFDEYMNGYYCKYYSEGLYFSNDDLYLCLEPFNGELPETDQEAFNKLIVDYKGEYFIENQKYSSMYVKYPSNYYNESYKNIAYLLGEEQESVMPKINN